jgi:hypothetical protein
MEIWKKQGNCCNCVWVNLLFEYDVFVVRDIARNRSWSKRELLECFVILVMPCSIANESQTLSAIESEQGRVVVGFYVLRAMGTLQLRLNSQ